MLNIKREIEKIEDDIFLAHQTEMHVTQRDLINWKIELLKLKILDTRSKRRVK